MFPRLLYLIIEKKDNNVDARMCQAVLDFQSVLANCNKHRAPLLATLASFYVFNYKYWVIIFYSRVTVLEIN